MPTVTDPIRFESSTEFDDTPPSPINVVILYDERDAYRAAVAVLSNALGEQLTGAEIHTLPWHFHQLRSGLSRERTLMNAQVADVFVISTVGNRPVPAYVVEWLRAAFECRRNLSPVVTTVYDENNDPHFFGSMCELLVRHESDAAGLHCCDPQYLASACMR